MRGALLASILVVLLLLLAGLAFLLLQRMRAGGYEWRWVWERDEAGGGEPGDGHDHDHEPDDLHAELKSLLGAEPSRYIYLNREGAWLEAGDDDSRKNRSSVLEAAGVESVEFPAFEGSAAAWRATVDCLKKQFAPFDVSVVDRRPVGERYVMVMVGGAPELLGEKATVSGLAPFNGGVIPDAVVFGFARKMKERPVAMCDTIAMEVAHAYGLDHEIQCDDPMSYVSGCGPRTFRDKAAPCGESKPRTCKDGSDTQNSYRRLLAVLGPRPEGR